MIKYLNPCYLLAPLMVLAASVAASDETLPAASTDPMVFEIAAGRVIVRETPEFGAELWLAHDGHENLIRDIVPGPEGSQPDLLAAWKDAVLFTAFSSQHGRELWYTDGTAAGTRLLADINPGSAHSNPHHFIPLNEGLYFLANSGDEPFSVWYTDGTAEGTYFVARNPESSEVAKYFQRSEEPLWAEEERLNGEQVVVEEYAYWPSYSYIIAPDFIDYFLWRPFFRFGYNRVYPAYAYYDGYADYRALPVYRHRHRHHSSRDYFGFRRGYHNRRHHWKQRHWRPHREHVRLYKRHPRKKRVYTDTWTRREYNRRHHGQHSYINRRQRHENRRHETVREQRRHHENKRIYRISDRHDDRVALIPADNKRYRRERRPSEDQSYINHRRSHREQPQAGNRHRVRDRGKPVAYSRYNRRYDDDHRARPARNRAARQENKRRSGHGYRPASGRTHVKQARGGGHQKSNTQRRYIKRSKRCNRRDCD